MPKKAKVTGKMRMRGEIWVRVVGPDGKIKGEVRRSNLVVTAGLTLLMNRLCNASPDSECLINYIAVGTGTATPLAANTQLQTETARKQLTSRANSSAVGSVATTFNAGDVPVSTLKEVGLFIDGTGSVNTGTLLARQNINLAVSALDSVFVDWRLTLADA